MPAGPAPTGFAYFLAVKYVGYTLFCKLGIETRLPLEVTRANKPMSALGAGAIRTAIGATIGAIVGLSFWKIPMLSHVPDSISDGLFFMLLIPVRIGEWWLLLRSVYAKSFPKQKQPLTIFLGILTSFALDAVGVVSALALPGGAWVC